MALGKNHEILPKDSAKIFISFSNFILFVLIDNIFFIRIIKKDERKNADFVIIAVNTLREADNHDDN